MGGMKMLGPILYRRVVAAGIIAAATILIIIRIALLIVGCNSLPNS